jgi:hypothetical protein
MPSSSYLTMARTIHFACHFGTEQIDRMPLDSDVGQECVCSVWTRGPKFELSLPALYRLSERLPDLRSR